MRTLKKTLCLVLCLAMMVGLCAFGASAEFTDADEISYAEEVNLLTGIGVIDGMGDGTFDPTGTLTREQAAKIITAMLGYGEIAPKAAPFDDVAETRWSAGYIAVCAGLGIVNGVGDNKFDPTGKLTAEMWEAMLLRALGYDAETEGMTGSSWEVGVARLTKKTNLSDDIVLNPLAEITREEACKLAYNALTVPEVEYNGGAHVSTGDGTKVDINNPASPTNTYIANNFGLEVAAAAGSTEKKDFTGNTERFGVITVNASNGGAAGKTTIGGTAYAIDTAADLLGHYVKIYTNKTGKTVYSVEDKSTVVRTAATYTNAAFVRTFGAASGYVVDGNEAVFVNGAVGVAATSFVPGTPSAAANTTYIFRTTTAADAPLAAGKKLLVAQFADNATDVTLTKVSKIITLKDQQTVTFMAPVNGGAAIPNGKINTTTGKAEDLVDEYEGMAEGDVVVVTKLGTIYHVAKPVTVTGKITAVAPATGIVTLDGKTYAQSTIANVDNAKVAAGALTGAMNLATVKGLTKSELAANSYTLYLDDAGNYITITLEAGTAAAKTIYYKITDWVKTDNSGNYSASNKNYVQVIDLDGKVENIYRAANAFAANTFFTTDPDANATLAAAGAKQQGALPAGYTVVNVPANLAITSTAKTVTIAGNAYYLTANTKYISYSGTESTLKTTVKTGPINTTLTGAATTNALILTDADGNKSVVAFVTATAFTDQTVDTAATLYVASNAVVNTTADGSTYTAYNVETGEKMTITCGATKYPTAANKFYSYTVKDGIYSLTPLNDGTAIKTNKNYQSKLGNSILAGTANGDGTYEVTADAAKAIFVDPRSAAAIAAAGVGELSSMYAIGVANDTKTVALDMLLDKTGAAVIVFIRSVT